MGQWVGQWVGQWRGSGWISKWVVGGTLRVEGGSMGRSVGGTVEG